MKDAPVSIRAGRLLDPKRKWKRVPLPGSTPIRVKKPVLRENFIKP
jgi:hypothetical protein